MFLSKVSFRNNDTLGRWILIQKLDFNSENARNTKNLTIIATTCHMDSCEWWMSNGESTLPPLITRHVASSGKNCEIFCILSIAFFIVEVID